MSVREWYCPTFERFFCNVPEDSGGVVVRQYRNYRFTRSLLVLAALFCVSSTGSLLWSNVAFAEEDEEFDDVEEVELTDTQLELYNDAVVGMQESPEDADKSVSLINAALVAGPEANLLYVSLGRAYQLMGDCDSAFEAFETAVDKPGVEGIPEQQIRVRLRSYIDELEDECLSQLTVECADPQTELFAEGIDELICDTPAEAPPGSYRVEAEVEDMSTAVNVTLRGGREATVEIGLDGRLRRYNRALERADSRVERAVEDGESAHRRAEDERREREAREREAAAREDEVTDAAEEEFVDMTGLHYQIVVNVPFGGYTIQSRDGALDIGLLVGGSTNAHVGYALNNAIGFEGRLQLGYSRGLPLAVKYLDDMRDNHEISYRSFDFGLEARTWLEFFGLGLFVEHRAQSLVFHTERYGSPATVAGPTVTLSGSGITRGSGEGYGQFSVRWAPLIHGDLGDFTVAAEVATGYAMIGLEYRTLMGAEEGESPVRAGEVLMLNLGFRFANMHLSESTSPELTETPEGGDQ